MLEEEKNPKISRYVRRMGVVKRPKYPPVSDYRLKPTSWYCPKCHKTMVRLAWSGSADTMPDFYICFTCEVVSERGEGIVPYWSEDEDDDV